MCTVGKNYADGQWHHLAHIYENGVGEKIFIDGVEVKSGASSASAFSWDTHIYLGYSSTTGQYIDGIIDEARIYDTPLTADQILWEYNATKP